MNTVPKAIAVLAVSLCAAAPVFAQSTTPRSGQATSSKERMAQAPSANTATQKVYNSSGDWIGTVTGITTNSYGQRLAAVKVERRMGMGSTTVLLPAGLLQTRDEGGFTTSLSNDDIKQLPRAGAK